jgi:ferredoxin
MFISGCSYCLLSELQSFKSFFAIGCLAEQDPVGASLVRKVSFLQASVLVQLCVANCFQCATICPTKKDPMISYVLCVLYLLLKYSLCRRTCRSGAGQGNFQLYLYGSGSFDNDVKLMIREPGKAKNFLPCPRIRTPMFRVYCIYWLNIFYTDADGDPELGKEISNLACLTQYTCCAFDNDVKFVFLSFVSYNICFFL